MKKINLLIIFLLLIFPVIWVNAFSGWYDCNIDSSFPVKKFDKVSDDWKSFIFIEQKDGKEFVNHNGLTWSLYDKIYLDSVKFLWTWNDLLYFVHDNQKVFYIRNWVESKKYDYIDLNSVKYDKYWNIYFVALENADLVYSLFKDYFESINSDEFIKVVTEVNNLYWKYDDENFRKYIFNKIIWLKNIDIYFSESMFGSSDQYITQATYDNFMIKYADFLVNIRFDLVVGDKIFASETNIWNIFISSYWNEIVYSTYNAWNRYLKYGSDEFEMKKDINNLEFVWNGIVYLAYETISGKNQYVLKHNGSEIGIIGKDWLFKYDWVDKVVFRYKKDKNYFIWLYDIRNSEIDIERINADLIINLLFTHDKKHKIMVSKKNWVSYMFLDDNLVDQITWNIVVDLVDSDNWTYKSMEDWRPILYRKYIPNNSLRSSRKFWVNWKLIMVYKWTEYKEFTDIVSVNEINDKWDVVIKLIVDVKNSNGTVYRLFHDGKLYSYKDSIVDVLSNNLTNWLLLIKNLSKKEFYLIDIAWNRISNNFNYPKLVVRYWDINNFYFFWTKRNWIDLLICSLITDKSKVVNKIIGTSSDITYKSILTENEINFVKKIYNSALKKLEKISNWDSIKEKQLVETVIYFLVDKIDLMKDEQKQYLYWYLLELFMDYGKE